MQSPRGESTGPGRGRNESPRRWEGGGLPRLPLASFGANCCRVGEPMKIAGCPAHVLVSMRGRSPRRGHAHQDVSMPPGQSTQLAIGFVRTARGRRREGDKIAQCPIGFDWRQREGQLGAKLGSFRSRRAPPGGRYLESRRCPAANRPACHWLRLVTGRRCNWRGPSARSGFGASGKSSSVSGGKGIPVARELPTLLL